MFGKFPALVVAVSIPIASIYPAQAQDSKAPPISEYREINHPVMGSQGMVSSHSETSSEVGAEILRNGGNAIDAAAAIGFALAVTLPRAGNIGGGGFMLVHLAEENRTVVVDFRETAPAAAYRDMYFDEDGNVDNAEYHFTHKSSAIPGSVAGFAHIVDKYGTMKLADILEPSIKLARDGFPVSYALAANLHRNKERLSRNAASRAKYFKADGSKYEVGEILKQPDLAWTLEQIAKGGADAFYKGDIARKIVTDMKANNGLITMEDVASYKVVEREPVRGSFRGYDIAAVSAPSSGGAHVVQMLNILENFPLKEMGQGSAASFHLMAEAMKLAFADRSKYLGDPDFEEVPTKALTSKDYAKFLASQISTDVAKPSAEIAPGDLVPYESSETTHYSVVDKDGNMVGNTYTLMFTFGSGVVVDGTGILMNNNMGNFTLRPDIPDAFGLIGSEKNTIHPGRRPVSSMSPIFVFKDGKPFLLTGTPGGSTIITANMQMVLNVLEFGMNIADATVAPRIHHQWLPAILHVESGVNADTIRLLRAKGHDVQFRNAMGSLQSIMLKDDLYYGYSDPRRPGAKSVGVD